MQVFDARTIDWESVGREELTVMPQMVFALSTPHAVQFDRVT
jgi:hypothetical protein